MICLIPLDYYIKPAHILHYIEVINNKLIFSSLIMDIEKLTSCIVIWL